MRKEDNKVKSDESIEDLQAELLRLQRQFRLLEDDRRAYREETEYSLRKQLETIRNLNIEYEELTKEDKLAGSVKNQAVDAQNTDALTTLLDEEDVAKKEFIERNSKLDNVNKQIQKLQETMDMQRKSLCGSKQSERRCNAILKLTNVMENRLNGANIKFNSALAENNNIRQKIDHINNQRRRFEDLHKKLIKIFTVGKEKKDFYIETATSLFNSRDEAHHRMQSLRERSERDFAQFTLELKDLIRVIDHDKKLREFMNTKTEERGEIYEAAVQGRKEKKMIDHVKLLQVEVEHYESIFQQLIEVSSLKDFDEMVSNFIRVEDENFALFNFAEEQNHLIQQKEEEIAEFKQNIASVGKCDAYFEKKHKEMLKKLQEEEVGLNNENQNVAMLMKTDSKILEKVRQLVNKTLDGIEIDRSVMTELLGGSKITNENLLPNIGLIEQKAIESTQAKDMVQQKSTGLTSETEFERTKLTFGKVGKLVRCMVLPPRLQSDSPALVLTLSDDALDKPMSAQEARQAAKDILKQEMKMPPLKSRSRI